MRHLLYQPAHDAVGEAGVGWEWPPAGGAEAELGAAALAEDVACGAGGDRELPGDGEAHRALQARGVPRRNIWGSSHRHT